MVIDNHRLFALKLGFRLYIKMGRAVPEVLKVFGTYFILTK